MTTAPLRTSRISGLFGYILGIIAIFGAYAIEGGNPQSLLVIPALLIIVGGTLSAAITGSSLTHILNIPQTVIHSLTLPRYNYPLLIEEIVDSAIFYRREGFLALENRIPMLNSSFMKQLLRYVVDGLRPETIRELSDMTIHAHITERMEEINLFRKMGGYSPTMCIIGTVMGLISTLASAGQDPTELIRHIATAFVATLWGILLANIVWLPIADKLQLSLDREVRAMEFITDGVLALQAGEPPMILRARLEAGI